MSKNELITGNIYYAITYADCNLTVPVIRSLVFLGNDLGIDDKSDGVYWYFQTHESMLKAGKYPDIDESEADLVELHRVQEKGLSLIFDLRELSEDIKECLDRIDRRGKQK
jgi:hypothetical protein